MARAHYHTGSASRRSQTTQPGRLRRHVAGRRVVTLVFLFAWTRHPQPGAMQRRTSRAGMARRLAVSWSQKAPLALRRAADAGYREHGTGGWPVPLRPCQRDEPPLERVLKLAVPAPNPICLPVSLPPGTGGKIFCSGARVIWARAVA